MPRDLIAEIDAIVASLGERIKEFFRRTGRLQTPVQTLQVEQELNKQGRQVADECMELAVLTSIEALQDSTPRPTLGGLPIRVRKMRSKGRRCTPICLLGGRQIVVRTRYHLPASTSRRGRRRGVGRRSKAGAGCFPHLVQLGILCGSTPATLSEVARQSAESNSYQIALDNLSRRGLDLDEKTLTRMAQGFGRLALHLRQAQMLAPLPTGEAASLAGKRVAVAVDGGRMRVRQPRRRGRRRDKTGYRGFDAPWREPKVLTVYILDQDGHKQRHSLSLYDATLGDAKALFALVVGYLRLLGAHQADLVVLLGDGARWIWDRVEELVTAAGIDPERFVAVVDYYHAVEHLRDVADLMCGWSPKRRRSFVSHYKRVLRQGEVEEVIAAIDELCLGRHAKALATERDYFARNADRMRYRDLEQRDLPIGSGAVESAVRQVVNQRVKSNGMFWLQDHAEHMLHLRAFLRAGRWDELVHATLAHQCTIGTAAMP